MKNALGSMLTILKRAKLALHALVLIPAPASAPAKWGAAIDYCGSGDIERQCDPGSPANAGLAEEQKLGGVSEDSFPKELQIDWVRVWQCRSDTASAMACPVGGID